MRSITVQTVNLTITEGDTVLSDWIDISTCMCVCLIVPKLPEDAITGLSPQYEVYIKYSSPDPVNTMAVDHGSSYVCGVNIYDRYYAKTELFDRIQELGANHIQIQLINQRRTSSIEAFLVFVPVVPRLISVLL